MTSLAAWIGIDSRGASSFYLVSDSRINWGQGLTWDYGRKLFSSQIYPDIFGYCGDVLFPSLILGQAVSLMDCGSLFSHSDNPSDRFKRLSNLIMKSFSTLPSCVQNPFTILYCSRLNESLKSTFELYRLDWSHKNGWKTSQPELPSHSDLILSLGSGKESILASHLNWQKTEVKGTSRSVFSAFCDSLESGRDPLSGGAPQLVGIYRKGAARSFGIIFNDQKYLLGLPVENENLKSVEWRNHLFEESDPNTNQRQTNAQPQPRPKSLGK
jgi:hypothetical protein